MMTLENNQLLADFIAIDKGDFEIKLPKFGWFDERKDKNSSKFLFHNDWNWLMSVVEKIEALCSNRGFEISSQFVHIRVDNNLTISSGVCSNRIEAVYSACVQFVKW